MIVIEVDHQRSQRQFGECGSPLQSQLGATRPGSYEVGETELVPVPSVLSSKRRLVRKLSDVRRT
jgi:hypothetical protein